MALLKSAEQPYRLLVEKMQEGAVTLLRDGTILYCNARFAELAGMPLEEVIGAPVPDITLTTLDGGTVRLRDLAGQIVLLNFWATWCVPCQKEMPLLQQDVLRMAQ